MTMEMLGGLEKYDEIIELFKLNQDTTLESMTPLTFYKMAFLAMGSTEFLRRMRDTQHVYLIHDVMGQIAAVFNVSMQPEWGEHPQEAIQWWKIFNARMGLLKNYRTNTIKGVSIYHQNPEQVSIRNALQICINTYSDHHINISGNDEVIFVDKQSVYRIFENLLSNAVRAMGKDGRLDIIIFGDGYIEFKNNGPAIPPDDMDKIFNEGFTTRTEKPHQHGLGLYIVKSILNEIGGEISVNSNEKETSFVVKLNHSA